jgi:putative glutamine amidotransferase
MKPVIGITRCSKLDDYIASIEQAGARARVLEVSESPRRLVTEVHGVLLTGGGDIDPVLYGEDRHPSVEDAEPGRDEFEIDLARRALDTQLPMLAICRGAQVLNVSAGGSLVQDIPSSDFRLKPEAAGLKPEATEHSITEPKDHVAHDVRVTAGSVLERALGAAVDAAHTCRVNSRHHQSVARLGRSLVASATASDGIIEAIESPASPFCVGVQWHPENFWRTGEFRPLFEAFVAAAAERLPLEDADGLDVGGVGEEVEGDERP